MQEIKDRGGRTHASHSDDRYYLIRNQYFGRRKIQISKDFWVFEVAKFKIDGLEMNFERNKKKRRNDQNYGFLKVEFNLRTQTLKSMSKPWF